MNDTLWVGVVVVLAAVIVIYIAHTTQPKPPKPEVNKGKGKIRVKAGSEPDALLFEIQRLKGYLAIAEQPTVRDTLYFLSNIIEIIKDAKYRTYVNTTSHEILIGLYLLYNDLDGISSLDQPVDRERICNSMNALIKYL